MLSGRINRRINRENGEYMTFSKFNKIARSFWSWLIWYEIIFSVCKMYNLSLINSATCNYWVSQNKVERHNWFMESSAKLFSRIFNDNAKMAWASKLMTISCCREVRTFRIFHLSSVSTLLSNMRSSESYLSRKLIIVD